MGRQPFGLIPAKVARTGKRQLSITLSDDEANHLEEIRARESARSWAEVVRLLIARSRRRP